MSKAHRLLYHSTLGSRVNKKKKVPAASAERTRLALVGWTATLVAAFFWCAANCTASANACRAIMVFVSVSFVRGKNLRSILGNKVRFGKGKRLPCVYAVSFIRGKNLRFVQAKNVTFGQGSGFSSRLLAVRRDLCRLRERLG